MHRRKRKVARMPLNAFMYTRTYLVYNSDHNYLITELVMNICNMDSTGSDSRPQYGVIRSHKHFPRSRPKSRIQCETIVPLRMRDSMVIDVFGDSVYTMLNVYVISRTNRAETRLKTKDVVHLHGNTTAAIKITADFRWKRRHIKGFMMSYSSTYIVYSI